MSSTQMIAGYSARRTQSLIDVGVSIFLGMVVWPFPVARAMLPPSVHVIGVLLTCAVMQAVYFTVAIGFWRQTLGMRLVGLVCPSASRAQALLDGFLSGVLALWYAASPRTASTARVTKRLIFVPAAADSSANQ